MRIAKKKFPTFKFEKPLWKKGYYVIGVDEVGRGALAGPLYVGAVCFLGTLRVRKNTHRTLRVRRIKAKPHRIEELGINDSKKLSPAKREKLAKIIKKVSLSYSTSSVQPGVINRLGIVKATEMAIRKAISNLISKMRLTNLRRSHQLGQYSEDKIFLLLDAFYVKFIKRIGLKNQLAIIHGDEKSISIAAASIIAKVERDHNMVKLDHKYPIYFWKNNKGYGTRKHIEAIKKFGKSKLHRDLFLRKILVSTRDR